MCRCSRAVWFVIKRRRRRRRRRLYRPGSTAVTAAFFAELADLLDRLMTFTDPIVLAGDINIR